MDLRKFEISPEAADAAFSILSYQPFVIDDDRYTGVAYSWLHTEDATLPANRACNFDRRTLSEQKFRASFTANRMLAATYDNFIEVVTERVPGGTMLDVACNNGYFPVLASLKGCSRAVGLDPGASSIYGKSFDLLNAITGAKAEFVRGGFAPDHHVLYTSPDNVNATPLEETFDIVTNSALLCHMGSPLHLLSALSRHARRALLIYSGFIDDDDYLIRYNQPKDVALPFPNCFNDGTVLSTKLFRESMRLLGFTSVEQVVPPPSGLQDRTPLSGMMRYGIMKAFLCLR